MIREQLKKAIKEAVSALSLETSEIHLEHPVDLTHGDYSTNVAMTLAKEVNKNPKELAQEIIDNLKEDKLIEKIEVAGNGFINFYLSKEFFAENLNEIIKTNPI